MDEDIVPKAGLEMALHLGKIKIGAGAARQELAGVVEEIEPEIKQASRDGLAVEKHMLLGQVPPARPHEERGRLWVQLVGLALGAREGNRAAHRIAEIDMAVEKVLPSRRRGVL